MANSKLQGKTFEVPDEVLAVLSGNLKKFSSQNQSKGFNRALFIIQRKVCTYEQLKRIKNYFDSITKDNFNETEYLLNGGDIMKEWVNFTLAEARKGVDGTKKARTHAGLTNQFRADSEETVKPVTPTIKKVPEFMSTSDLMAEIYKINEISKKLI